MPRVLLILAMATVILLPGCATKPERASASSSAYDSPFKKNLAARQRAYERLLTFVESGMTRRQLYALLPPAGPPKTGSELVSIAGVYSLVLVGETYPLDQDFSLRVLFTPVDPFAAFKAGSPGKSQSTSSTSRTINAKEIDELLFGKPGNAKFPKRVFKPSPDDRVAGRPVLLLRKPSVSDQDSLRNFPFSGTPVTR